MSNATQVLRGQISLQHVQHSLTDAAESLLGARAKKPTGHQEVAGASLSRMLFWSKNCMAWDGNIQQTQVKYGAMNCVKFDMGMRQFYETIKSAEVIGGRN